MDRHDLLRPDIAAMDPYEPIVPVSILAEQLGLCPEEILKLDANENPYGPSPRAAAAVALARDLHLYPDPESNLLRQALSAFCDLPMDLLLVGAGADELIDLTVRATISPGETVINCPPSFGMYPFAAAINMARTIDIRRRPDFSLNVAAIERAATQSEAKLLFLCSPNNPDGSLIDDQTLRRLLGLPLLVVLDEAYVEFSITANGRPSSRISWTQKHDNLVVLRTFSKLAGLAGLRVGYGAFPRWLSPHLWKIKQPYNVNASANQAALAALQDISWLEETSQKLAQERDRMFSMLGRFDFLTPYPSQANFVLCQVKGMEARELQQALRKQGVLVRYFAKAGLENCLRISVGKPEDTDRLCQVMAKIKEQCQS